MSNSNVLRDVCDACHGRKMRCPSEGVGVCVNCRRTGQVCQFSPRSEMGRHRLGSISSRRCHSQKSGKSTNTVNITPAPTTTSPVETEEATLLQDRCQPEARYIAETNGAEQADVNMYMETDLNQNSGPLKDADSTLVATAFCWGSIPLADPSTALPGSNSSVPPAVRSRVSGTYTSFFPPTSTSSCCCPRRSASPALAARATTPPATRTKTRWLTTAAAKVSRPARSTSAWSSASAS